MSTFSDQQLQTIRAHLEKLEQRIHLREQQDFYIPGIWVAKTDGSGVTAMAGDTPGTGTATLYEFSSTNVLVSLGVTDTVYNLSSTAVAASTYIQIKQEASGRLLVDFEDCG